jgi:hypothetical protein
MIYGSLFKHTPNLSFFMYGRGTGKVEFEPREIALVLKNGRWYVSPGALPKFVVPVLGTVPFRWSAEGFGQTIHQNRILTSLQNIPTLYYFLLPLLFSLYLFLCNLEGEQPCHIII